MNPEHPTSNPPADDREPRREAILHAATLALRARTRRRSLLRGIAATGALFAMGALAAWRLTSPAAPPDVAPTVTPAPLAAGSSPEPERPPLALDSDAPPAPIVSRRVVPTPISELSDDELLDALAEAGYRTGLVRTPDEVWLVGDPIPASADLRARTAPGSP
ncbi:MAG: hypothetical protein EA378_03655 [Phycisphaerales bacterium]|nr:MAG: hypothetical protein EA378_03655 [Phycisphaerales bacterium]